MYQNLSLTTFIGNCVYLMIRSIWSSWEAVPNSMPAGNGTNTRDWVSFFIFWLCSLPAIWVGFLELHTRPCHKCGYPANGLLVPGSQD
jgi:cytosine/uracil/thiamine/allantoin permease